jgi:5-methylcytosine-specific restriction endonuclease McrA
MGVRRKWFDWVAMQAGIDSGAGYRRCHELFGIAHATWKKAIRLGDLHDDPAGRPYADARNRYDWAMIQRYHDQGNSVRACQGRFGFSLNSWFKARKRGSIASRGMPKKSIDGLARNRSNRGNIKRRLSERGVLPYVCAICGISQWQGRPLTLQIDHVNGKRLDYRLDNLRLLCANCHSQTDTFGGRNLVALRRNPG